MVSGAVAGSLPVVMDDIVMVSDDVIEDIHSLTPRLTPSSPSADLPDDPVACLEALLDRIRANRRAA
jgi:hypothetical protein